MSRSLPEWIGEKPETSIPNRVQLRIVDRQSGKCMECYRVFDPKLKPVFDHRPALINGGENRESCIEAVCFQCHALRTKSDVSEKAKINRLKTSFLSLKKEKKPKSKWKRKVDGTVVLREPTP